MVTLRGFPSAPRFGAMLLAPHLLRFFADHLDLVVHLAQLLGVSAEPLNSSSLLGGHAYFNGFLLDCRNDRRSHDVCRNGLRNKREAARVVLLLQLEHRRLSGGRVHNGEVNRLMTLLQRKRMMESPKRLLRCPVACDARGGEK